MGRGKFGKLLLSRAPEALSFPRRVTQPETDGPSGGMENQYGVGGRGTTMRLQKVVRRSRYSGV